MTYQFCSYTFTQGEWNQDPHILGHRYSQEVYLQSTDLDTPSVPSLLSTSLQGSSGIMNPLHFPGLHPKMHTPHEEEVSPPPAHLLHARSPPQHHAEYCLCRFTVSCSFSYLPPSSHLTAFPSEQWQILPLVFRSCTFREASFTMGTTVHVIKIHR